MSGPEFTRLIATLRPEEKTAVAQFITHIRQQQPQGRLNFRDALNKFTREHGDLLKRLAQ